MVMRNQPTSVGIGIIGAQSPEDPKEFAMLKTRDPPAAAPSVLIGRVGVDLVVNGRPCHAEVEPWTTLLDFLRHELDLTGTKKGCDHGQCGACTVLVDGKRINSCLALACSKDGAQVVTVEGLAGPDHLHPLQKAFIERDAFQCGYCTPGQLCSAQGLLNEGHATSREEIREYMSGNLCRCGAYTNIVDAIEDVARGRP
jgi:xanthine dehydrogenase YagT iron-sulfur-binding subunit